MVNSMFVLYLFSYKVDVVKVPIIDSNFKPLNLQNQQQILHNGNKIVPFDDAQFGRVPETKPPCQAHFPTPFLYPNMASTPAIMMPVLRQASRLQDTLPGMYPSMANTPNMVMPETKQPSRSQFPLQMTPPIVNMASMPNAMMPMNQPCQTHFPLPVVSPLRILPILHAMPAMNHRNQPQSNLMYPNLPSMQETKMSVMKQPCQAQPSYPVMYPNTPNTMPVANRQSQPQFPLPVLSPLRILPILHTMPAMNQPSQAQSTFPGMYSNMGIMQDMMMPVKKHISQPHFPSPVVSPLRILPILHTMPEANHPSQAHLTLPGALTNSLPTSHVNNQPSHSQFPWSLLSSPRTNSPEFFGPVMHMTKSHVNNQQSQPQFPWSILSSPRHIPNTPDFLGPVMHMPMSPINSQPSQSQFPWSVLSSPRHMLNTPDFLGPVMHMPTSPINSQPSQSQFPWSVLSSPRHMLNTPDFLGPVMHMPTSPINSQPSQSEFPWPVLSSPRHIPNTPEFLGPVMDMQPSHVAQLPWSVLSSSRHMPNMPELHGPVMHMQTSHVNNQLSQPQLPWSVLPSLKSNPFVPNMPGLLVNHPKHHHTSLPMLNSNKPSLTDLLMPLIRKISQSHSDLPTTPQPSTPTTIISINKHQPELTSNPEMIIPTPEIEEEESVIMREVEQPIEPESTSSESSPIIDMPNTPEFVVLEEETLPVLPEADGLPSVSSLPTVQVRPMSADLKPDFKDDNLTDGPVFIELPNSIY